MPYQNISAVLDMMLVNETVAKIQSSKNSLSFLINLNEDEKRNLPKMGDKSVSFVEKSLEYANQNPNLIPPYLDIPIFIPTGLGSNN